MDLSGIHSAGSYGAQRRLSPAGTGAQIAGSNSPVTGPVLDRFAAWGGAMPRTAQIAALYDTTLSVGKTLGFTFTLQDSGDGVNFVSYATQAATIVATGAGTSQGQTSFPADLGGARRYVRLIVTPVMSATSTDTVTFVSVGWFAGFDRLIPFN